MRKPFIAANWKMHKTVEDAVKFVEEVQHRLPSEDVLTCGLRRTFSPVPDGAKDQGDQPRRDCPKFLR